MCSFYCLFSAAVSFIALGRCRAVPHTFSGLERCNSSMPVIGDRAAGRGTEVRYSGLNRAVLRRQA